MASPPQELLSLTSSSSNGLTRMRSWMGDICRGGDCTCRGLPVWGRACGWACVRACAEPRLQGKGLRAPPPTFDKSRLAFSLRDTGGGEGRERAWCVRAAVCNSVSLARTHTHPSQAHTHTSSAQAPAQQPLHHSRCDAGAHVEPALPCAGDQGGTGALSGCSSVPCLCMLVCACIHACRRAGACRACGRAPPAHQRVLDWRASHSSHQAPPCTHAKQHQWHSICCTPRPPTAAARHRRLAAGRRGAGHAASRPGS